ncbi:hypothetical protein PUN28_001302 [Cardiocondyla obscurior]|uniref:Uncharacterized protein n=1 Tax=Cardiocondyla obscurior TaxID=286306 RepID=A0AAW2H4N4_9HYME
MFWCYGYLSFLLLLLDNAYGDAAKSRTRRQITPTQNGQLIDDIFNIPITAIRQTSSAAQIISPENTQTIDNLFKIPVSTLEAVGALVKSAREQRQQNLENNQTFQQRRERILALKQQKRKRKEDIYNQRLMQQRLKRTVKQHHSDPFGLNALSSLLVGHHAGGILGHHSGLGGGIHGLGNHRIGHRLHGHKIHHGGHFGNRPQHTYEVHEDVNEDTSFSWHGLTAGISSLYGTRPSTSSIKIENKIAPKEKRQKVLKYPSGDVNPQNKLTKIRSKPSRGYDEPPLENKIAPRSGRVAFVQ